MRAFYYCSAGAAILFASALLALQIVGGLEYTHGQSDYVRWSMVAAMITVAILPMLIDAAWRIHRLLAVCLFVGFVAFLAYSLPASIGRIGEVKEAKALAADDAATLKDQLADVRKTLRFAEPDMERECAGAPDPLPSDVNRWPECRRKRGSVTAFLNERKRLETALASMGTARLGDTSSQLLAWALAPVGISEETIRKGSGMALPIGLEVVIFSLFGVASVAVRKGLAISPRRVVLAPAEAKSLLREPDNDLPPSNGGTPIDDLIKRYAGTGLDQQQIAAKLGVGTATVSRHLQKLEAGGMITRTRAGKSKLLA